jgi:hypothetical protein
MKEEKESESKDSSVLKRFLLAVRIVTNYTHSQ